MGVKQSERCRFSSDICQRISSNRTYAMGIGIIVVMLFHASLFRYGHWGVDLFMFVSGFGIYSSLNKFEKVNYSLFYKKRLLRIMPAACISGSLIAFINYFFNNIAHHDFILPYGFDYIMWACGLHLWYIRSILIIYFISPFVFIYIKNNFKLHKFAIIFLSLIILLYLTTYFSHYIPSSIGALYKISTKWTIVRFPAFLTGMIIACYGSSYRTKLLKEITASLFCLTIAVLFRLHYIPHIPVISHCYGLLEFLFILPPIVVFCSHLDTILRQAPALIRKVLFWAGSYSLELYVVHEALYTIIGKKMETMCNHWVLLIFAITASILSAYLLKLATSSLQRRFLPTLGKGS